MRRLRVINLISVLMAALRLAPALAAFFVITGPGNAVRADEPSLPPPNPAKQDDRVGVKWGVAPIGNYTTDKGLTVGALGQRFGYGTGERKPFDNLLTFLASYGTKGPREALVEYEVTGIGSANLRLDTQLYFSYDTHTRYYGLGPDSFRDPVLEAAGYNYYLRRAVYILNSVRKTVAPQLDVFAGLNFISERQEPTDPNTQYAHDFGPDSLSLLYGQVQLGAILERRDSEFIPSKGDYASVLFTGAPSWLSNGQASWGRIDADYRRYDPIIPDRWLYFASEFRYSTSSDATPLFEKAKLGSLFTLRGYPLNRYLDNHSVTLRGELRSVWFRWHVLGVPLKGGTGLFVDTGRVADTFGGLGSSPTRVAGGFALFGSYFTDDFLGSADFGFSQDGTSLYLHLAHAF